LHSRAWPVHRHLRRHAERFTVQRFNLRTTINAKRGIARSIRMMTAAQITAAVLEIRARPSKEETNNPKPVLTPWAPTVPFVALANPHAMRGHAEYHPSDARDKKLIACATCLQDKPRGGWSDACPNDRRLFKGG
jgi:hypothetical protein